MIKMDKTNRIIVMGIMLVLVLTSLASAKNYGVVDYMFDKKMSFTEIVGKTINDFLEGARFFTLVHEDGSIERVALLEESVRESFDEDEMNKRKKIKNGFGAFLRGNYSFWGKSVFDEDSVGSATVLINSTSVRVNFTEEYDVVPIVTLTSVGLPNFFYGVDNISVAGFNILISEAQAKEVVFNWHAFAQVVPEVVNVSNVTEGNITNGTVENVTIEINGTVSNITNGTVEIINNLTEGNLTWNENLSQGETLNETITNETVETNETVDENKGNGKGNNGTGNANENANNNSAVIDTGTDNNAKVEAEAIIEETAVEELPEVSALSLITGGVIGVNGGQENVLEIFSRLFRMIFNFIDGEDE